MVVIRVFDLETTGFTPDVAGVCEVAFVNLVSRGEDLAGDATDWEVEDGISSWLTNPGHPIPPETSAIHHIVDEDVAAAPGFAMICNAIFLNPGCEVVALGAHSAKFEQQWLTPDRVRHTQWICTYKCALRLFPDAPGHSNQALRYWLKPEGLDRSVANVAHRAGPDAYVTAFLLREMLKLATLDQLVEWSSQPALQVRCHIGQNRGKLWSEVDFGFLTWVANRDFDEDVLFTVKTEIRRRRELERAAAAAEG
jgi:exodeoxyribonuclease X